MCIFLFNVDAISHTVKKGKNNIIRVITIQLLTRTDGNIRFELDFCLKPFVQTQQFVQRVALNVIFICFFSENKSINFSLYFSIIYAEPSVMCIHLNYQQCRFHYQIKELMSIITKLTPQS